MIITYLTLAPVFDVEFVAKYEESGAAKVYQFGTAKVSSSVAASTQ